MSVSIFNNFHYNDISVLKITEAKMHHSMPQARLDNVRRNLFGPVDRKECSRFAEEELAKHQMSASQKWGFDFVRGCPLDDTKLFLWERVPPTNEIPEMYALSRAAHIRPIDPDRTPSKRRRHTRRDSFLDLYDELHDRSNRYDNSGKNSLLDLSFEDVDGGHTSASSCDEDSFEDDIDNNMMCDLNWMPSTSELEPSPCVASTTTSTITAAPIATTATTTTTTTSITSDSATQSSDVPTVCVNNADGLATVFKQHVASHPICDTSCSDKSSTISNCIKSMCTNVTATTATSPSSGVRVLRNSPRIREKRQFKITDFLKERKRLQPAQKKISPKKARISPPSASSQSSPVITNTILSHFRRSPTQ